MPVKAGRCNWVSSVPGNRKLARSEKLHRARLRKVVLTPAPDPSDHITVRRCDRVV